MEQDIPVVALLPLRAGSKGVPGKNKGYFHGKPLFMWQLDALLDSEFIHHVYVATDDTEIIDIINEEYRPMSKLHVYERSSQSARDDASTEEVLLEFIEHEQLDPGTILVLSQATNPFPAHYDYTAAVRDYMLTLLIDPRASMVSVALSDRFYWDGDFDEPLNYDPMNRPRRQDVEDTGKVLVENGAFYINTISQIQKHKCRINDHVRVYRMPTWTVYEIDTPEDWEICHVIFQAYRGGEE